MRSVLIGCVAIAQSGHWESRKMLNAQQMEQREALADAEFAQYEFGDGVTVSESDNWDKNDVADFTKIVYITCDVDAPDADSERVSFHVRFNADGSVARRMLLATRESKKFGCREHDDGCLEDGEDTPQVVAARPSIRM